jgi:bifunctional pyridoxal-dependent enzyme with beta-cystathionase and maltose regulon repressor activities
MYGFYTHEGFIDVLLEIKKAYYIKEKNLYELTCMWWHKRHGYEIAREKLRVAPEKLKEFKKI